MKERLLNKLVAGILVIIAIGMWVNPVYTAVTGESLLNVQNSATTFLNGVRVKDAGNIADNITSGLVAVGLMGYDGTGWDRALSTSGALNVHVSSSTSGSMSVVGTK